MGWFRGDEHPTSQARYGGKPLGGLPEQLAARQAAKAEAETGAAGNGGRQPGNGWTTPH